MASLIMTVGQEVIISSEEVMTTNHNPFLTAKQNGVGFLTGGNSRLPHNLNLQDVNGIQDVLEDRPEYYEAFQKLFKGHLAQSSHRAYDWVLGPFKTYCHKNNFDYPHFSRRAATEFLAWSVQEGKSYQWFKKYKPALISLETTIGREVSEVPAMIATGCSAMMRQLAETKPKTKKAIPFGAPELRLMFERVIWSRYEKGETPRIEEFRCLLRGVIYYYTWLRFDDYSQITERDVEDFSDHVKIKLQRSKQDQFYVGTHAFIPETGGRFCPANCLRMYGRLFGYTFGPTGSSGRYLNCAIFNHGGDLRMKHHQKLSYSTAMQQMRLLIKTCGIHKRYTETSFKAGGVSAYLESGQSLESCMVHGRWRGINTPLFYLRETNDYRLSLAQRVPSISNVNHEIVHFI